MKFQVGCAHPEHYQTQLEQKVRATKAELSKLAEECSLEVFPSPPEHFRMRAEFKIWHEKGEAFYAMYEPGEYKRPILIKEFSIGSEPICELMPRLLQRINQQEELRYKVFQIEFLSTLSKQMLVTLIYHKALGDSWENAARGVASEFDIKIIGRSRKQKVVLSEDFVEERLPLEVGETRYQQIETGFTQPNARVCIAMLNWCSSLSEGLGGDLLELYCGNGNFTIPLSYHFEKVLATEISKVSTKSAIHNIQLNNRSNIELVRLSAEEVSEALSRKRTFRRLAHIDLDRYAFSTVFVDPPRSGIDDETLHFINQFEYIIYISCNPETLNSNLNVLLQSHHIEKFALFDQFPYTDHRECGVFLKKR